MGFQCDNCPAEWDYGSGEDYFTIEKKCASSSVRGEVLVTLCRRCFTRALLRLPFKLPFFGEVPTKTDDGG